MLSTPVILHTDTPFVVHLRPGKTQHAQKRDCTGSVTIHGLKRAEGYEIRPTAADSTQAETYKCRGRFCYTVSWSLNKLDSVFR
ncbi:unnamed protein product [Acanthoscelides obtectus]|uniref:Uncharacterized protein n=1 Tax=Acanthoscelides obtectus TaxID=200917 RepID=A0A9P0JMZ8_ACAOB|nr:unnamed protein product [Acanthoscelides obtectus]CAK1672804.1 hypothetical protein AOBTE_LOCUS29096 [Acanthoscelides obtectus]